MKPLETSVEEVLRHAIQSEVDTRAFYQRLAERAATPAVRKRLIELADGELLHRAKLERRYREVVGREADPPQAPHVELPPELQNVDMSRALKHALERERDAESYFRFQAERVPVDSDLGKLFLELAETEWRHKIELQAEYDAAAGPDRFLMDI